MSLFLFNGFPSTSSVFSSKSPTTLHCTFNRFSCQLSIKRKPISSSIIPARDRIIDFGKHRGKMLGTLPSKYLKWVSKNLRARDFEEWAKLADEVLEDPLYKDRLEWEFVENILTGDRLGRTESSVSDLLEFSERFGWDNDDKLAWSKIEFSLLGTSKGSRIPRKGSSNKIEKIETLSEKTRGLSTNSNKKKGVFRKSSSGVSVDGEEVGSVKGKREERIERMRLKRGLKMNNLELEIGGEKKKDREYNLHDQYKDQDQDQMVNNTSNRFPGREAFLKKVLNSRRFL